MARIEKTFGFGMEGLAVFWDASSDEVDVAHWRVSHQGVCMLQISPRR